jgi:hypothetical protein
MSRSPAKNGPRYRSTKVFCRAISRECHRPSEKIADGMHPTLPCSCGPRSRLQLPPRLRTYLPLLDTFPVQSPQRQTSRLPTPRLGRSPQREGVFFLPCKNIACPRPIRKPQLTSFIRRRRADSGTATLARRAHEVAASVSVVARFGSGSETGRCQDKPEAAVEAGRAGFDPRPRRLSVTDR